MRLRTWLLLVLLTLLCGVLTAWEPSLGGLVAMMGGAVIVTRSRVVWPGRRGLLAALGFIFAGALLATAVFGLSCSGLSWGPLGQGCRSQTLRQALNIHLIGALLGGVLLLFALWQPMRRRG